MEKFRVNFGHYAQNGNEIEGYILHGGMNTKVTVVPIVDDYTNEDEDEYLQQIGFSKDPIDDGSEE